jgi:enamine deaminase RidA (YjgF/YER057c/UK114 family)
MMKDRWQEALRYLRSWVDEHWGLLRLGGLAVWVLGGVVVISGVISINLDTQSIAVERAETTDAIESVLQDVKKLQQESLAQGERIEDIVTFVEVLRSPESEEAQRSLLSQVLAIARCDGLEGNQEVIDALVDAELVDPRVIQCPVHPGPLNLGG